MAPTEDSDVVGDRRERRGGEPAPGVEHARGDGAQGEEDRAQQHDPGQLDRPGLLLRAEARCDQRDDGRREDEEQGREHEQADEHEVRDRRHDPPGAIVLARREEPGRDRDERRAEGPRGHELEDEVRDPERGKERVQLAAHAERRADDDDADVADHPRHEERSGDDQPGAGEGVGPVHGRPRRRTTSVTTAMIDGSSGMRSTRLRAR